MKSGLSQTTNTGKPVHRRPKAVAAFSVGRTQQSESRSAQR